MIEEIVYASVCTLGVTRITLVVAADEIGRPVRQAFDPESFMGMLLSCTDCLSFWTALPVALLFLASPAWAAAVMLPWAVALAAALIARRY